MRILITGRVELKNILLVGVLSAVVGSLYAYPDIRFIHELGRDYAGIHLMGAVDEPFYLGRIRGVYKGDYRLGNVGIYEHRDDPYLLPPVPELIEGMMGKSLGLTISQLDTVFTFLMPALAFLLIFWLAFRISKGSRTAMLAGLSVLLGYHLFTPSLGVLHKLFSEGLPLYLVRPISPQFHFVPFMLALLLIYRCLEGPRLRKTFVAGVSVGALFYMSLYYWTFVFAGLGVFLVIALMRGRRDLARTILAIFGIALLVSVPYLLEAFSVRSSPHMGDLQDRYGLLETHRPILPLFQVLLSILVIFVYRPKGDVPHWFITSFLVGGLICLNQQILTGYVLEPIHWQSYTNKSFIILALILTAPTAIPFHSNRLKIGMFYGATFLLITMATLQQTKYYMRDEGTYRKLQPLARPLQWLAANTQKDDVVLTDPIRLKISEYVSTYTNNYVYLSDPHFITSLLSREEIEERYLSALRFYGHSREAAVVFFRSHGGGGLFLGMRVHPLYGGDPEQNEQYVRHLEHKYAVLLQDNGVHMTNYKVDYALVSGPPSPRFVEEENNGSLVTVYDDGLFRIYKVSSSYEN